MAAPRFTIRFAFLLLCTARVALAQVTDPHITSWLTANSAKYARVYETTSDKTSGNAVSTWPRSGLTNGGGGQATAAYSDIQRVAYSTNYVYIYTTGYPSYTMGNWLTPNGQTYTSWPANRAAIHRIPRTPSIPTTKQLSHGNGGVLVNGVFVWENGDAQSYANSSSTASVASISMSGDGIWNRLAGVAETFNFDPANGHQPNTGAYHNHINPKALRYQLGDNVTYDSSSKSYSEAGTPTKHSPIIGWANDGLPIYGPYGYSTATDATSGIRRMVSGFVKRDSSGASTYGTDDLAVTGRVKLPVWAASVQGKGQTLTSSQYGPTTTATYALGPVNNTCVVGTFAEDYEYLGDLGKTQGVDFDLNRQNVRYCVTPEYPGGTYAYFVCIDSSGNTVFPDMINQEYFGTAAIGTGTVSSISESVTEYSDAGPAAAISVTAAASGSNVALSWNSAEGATYKVESSSDNVTFTTLSSTVTSGGLTTSYTATTSTNYYRVTLTALATYDSGGTYGTPVGKTATVLFGTAATAPSITTQPASATVTAGTSVTFTVAASGTGTLSYQWKKAGSAISGATSASYTITSPQSADGGSYTVTVANAIGSTTSNAAVLTVNAATTAPTITTQPSGATVTAGASVTFTVVASGTAPLSYQWYKGGSAIGGATSATYALVTTQVSDSGSYSVAIVNSAGSVTSNAVTLTVNAAATAPSITTQPAGTSVTTGASVTFTVVASGTAPLSYQWSKNGSAISGATGASYTIASAQAGDAASYTVTVTNSAGSVTSSAAALAVNASVVAPAVTTQPVGATVTAGASVTFTLVASGTAPLSYQWQKGGAAISGATSASYTLSSVQATDAGSYTCVVTNSAGTATSNAATLIVNPAATSPSITTQPASATVTAGSAATFTVVASGTAPLSYQWYKNSVAISGATATTYTIASAQSADAGSYVCVVSNSAGSTGTNAATLTVSAAPVAPGIATQPASTTVTVGGGAVFTVVANGTAPLAYQWYKGVAAIAGATASSYSLTGVQAADAGSYSCVVTNSVGSATSNAATLTVTTPATAPAITTQPANATVTAGGNATFTVTASGTVPLGYQWQKNGAAIGGATSSSYTVVNAQAADAGTYVCVVTNSAGSATSAGASLTVSSATVAPSIATQPVNTTVTTGASVTFAVVANGTAPLTYQWQKNGAAIAGGTGATYTIAAVQTTDAGNFSCTVTNSAGNATSNVAVLVVSSSPAAPIITTQPASVSITAGGSATFGIVASGTAPLSYQWYKGVAALGGATSASFTVASAQPADAGSYTCIVTNSAGSATSNAATLTITSASTPPSITAQPPSMTVVVGGGVTFSVVASGTAPLGYQWYKNSAAIAGATAPSFSIASAQPSDAGSYACTVTNGAGFVTSAAATLTVTAATPPAATLAAGIVNLAVRTRIGGSAGTPIVGFVLGGSGAGKRLIIRAVGPTLIANFGLTSALADPQLQLWSGNTVIGSNDNWLASDAAAMAAAGAFPLNAGSGDAAIVTTLAPGAYTTPVSGAGNTSGVVLVEAYDGASDDTSARLINASARAYVGTGADLLIPGFVIAGEGTVKMLVRAVGPGLAAFGVPGTLADPQITLYSGSTAIAANDDWGNAANAADIAATSARVGAFALPAGSQDAVLLVSLSAGAYTAVVSGAGATTGTVIVELYVVP